MASWLVKLFEKGMLTDKTQLPSLVRLLDMSELKVGTAPLERSLGNAYARVESVQDHAAPPFNDKRDVHITVWWEQPK